MWPDWVSNLGSQTYESGALQTALHGPARQLSCMWTGLLIKGDKFCDSG